MIVVDERRIPDRNRGEYRLSALCGNCRTELEVRLVKGQDKPFRVACPLCECWDMAVWGDLVPEFEWTDAAEVAT